MFFGQLCGYPVKKVVIHKCKHFAQLYTVFLYALAEDQREGHYMCWAIVEKIVRGRKWEVH